MKMLAWIAREYFTGARHKRTSGRAAGFVLAWMIYGLFTFPGIMGYLNSARSIVIYVVTALPLAFIAFDTCFWQLSLPKLMFLCPLDESMRRSYIKGACRFRVALHTALGVVGALITLCLGNDWLGVAALAVNAFFFSIIGIGVSDSVRAVDGNIRDDEGYMRYFRQTAVRVIGTVLALILQMIYADVARSGGIMCQAGWERAVIGCLAAVLALFTIRYRTYWRSMQEAAICYEQPGKQPRGWKN